VVSKPIVERGKHALGVRLAIMIAPAKPKVRQKIIRYESTGKWHRFFHDRQSKNSPEVQMRLTDNNAKCIDIIKTLK